MPTFQKVKLGDVVGLIIKGIIPSTTGRKFSKYFKIARIFKAIMAIDITISVE